MLVNGFFICDFAASMTLVWSAIVHLTSEDLSSTSKIAAFSFLILKKKRRKKLSSPGDLARPLHKKIVTIEVSFWNNVGETIPAHLV